MDKKTCHLLFLFLIFLFITINNLIILKFDQTPLVGPSFGEYFRSLTLSGNFLHPLKLLKLMNKGYYVFFPPLFSLSSLPLFFLFGTSPDIACMTNIIYLAILILSIYKIGKILCCANAGLLATFIIMTYPIVFGLSRWYVNSFASLSLISLSAYYLIKAEGTKEFRYLLFSNFYAGISFLVRTSSIYFFIGLLIFKFSEIILSQKKSLKEKILIISLSLTPLFFIVGGWLYWTKAALFRYYGYTDFKMTPDFSHILEGLKYHFGFVFFNIQVHWFYAIIFFISAPFLIKKKPKQALLLLAWYLIPLIIISSYKGGECRHLMVPALGSIALISSLGVFYIPWHKLRFFIIISIYIFGIFQYFTISYHPAATKFYSKMNGLKLKLNTEFNDYCPNNMGILQSRNFDWGAKKILSIIGRDNKNYGRKGEILLIYSNASTFSQLIFEGIDEKNFWKIYYAESLGRSIRFFEKDHDHNDLANYILKADYVLSYDKENYQWKNGFRGRFWTIFNRYRDKFINIGNVNMPNDLKLYIYRNKERKS